MKPEASDYLATARRHLAYARRTLSPDEAPIAAREAYMAAFHAAQAMIFERAGKSAKTHNGVRSRFHELTRHEPGFPRSLRSFLSTGFALKSSADYSSSEVPTFDQATEAVGLAEAFLRAVEGLIAG